jgi:excisionase family DNA binding protein
LVYFGGVSDMARPLPDTNSARPDGVALALDVPGEVVEQIAQRAAAIVVEHEAPSASPWLTVGEAAEYLRCPKSRVYSLVSARRIPFVKDGSRTLFSRGELDAWLHNGGGKRP